VSKRLEYKVLTVSTEELETTLNIYAQDGFRAVHFFSPDEQGHLSLVLSRKQKSRKKHHEVFEDDHS
jgi:hypothetical protein